MRFFLNNFFLILICFLLQKCVVFLFLKKKSKLLFNSKPNILRLAIRNYFCNRCNLRKKASHSDTSLKTDHRTAMIAVGHIRKGMSQGQNQPSLHIFVKNKQNSDVSVKPVTHVMLFIKMYYY